MLVLSHIMCIMSRTKMEMLDLEKSNQYIKQLIDQAEPFFISRLGWVEGTVSADYINTGKINEKHLHPQLKTLYNPGIYSRDQDVKKMELFCKYYDFSLSNSNALACFDGMLHDEQNFYSKRHKLEKLTSKSLEPFYAIIDGLDPWSLSLYEKKVLIINPFVNSFRKQLSANFQMFKNKNIFNKKQDFVFYKPYQTIAGNHIHNDWIETFKIMRHEISKMDFDIALLGCGGYGLPLCDFIKTQMNKSAIYIGGGLQLLFGVMGGRWENWDFWKNLINEHNPKFIRPSEEEQCFRSNHIEGGCYW